MTAFAHWAAFMLDGGYSPIPISTKSGHPLLKRWPELRNKAMSSRSIGELSRKHPDLQLGVIGGHRGLVPIDVDTDDPDVIDAVTGALPEPVVVRQGSKGFVAFYYDPTGKIAGRNFVTPKPAVLVEVLVGRVVTIPRSLHRVTGKPYRWSTKRTLLNTRVDELSVITPAHIEALAKALEPWVPKPLEYIRVVVDDATPVSDKRWSGYAHRVLESTVAELNGLTEDRNISLYRAACKLGKFVHKGHLAEGTMINALMAACVRNGYHAACVKKFGRAGTRQCLDTIRSGLRKSRGDSLPTLPDRPRPDTRYQQAAGV